MVVECGVVAGVVEVLGTGAGVGADPVDPLLEQPGTASATATAITTLMTFGHGGGPGIRRTFIWRSSPWIG
jgi:hypothetical protein